MADMRTPLKIVRRLGSAKEGTEHFWRQRLTAIANLLLVPFFIVLMVSLAGTDYATVRRTLGHPIWAVAMSLFVISVAIHMRIGVQIIVEDYVHGEGAKIVLLMLNTFYAVVVASVSVFALMKLSFGA